MVLLTQGRSWTLHGLSISFGAVLLYGICLHSNQVKSVLFLLHPILVTLALVLSTQAIIFKHTFPLLYLPSLRLNQNTTTATHLNQLRYRRINFTNFKLFHAAIQTLSLVFLIVAILCIYTYRVKVGKASHFKSYHSWIGIFTVYSYLVTLGIRGIMMKIQRQPGVDANTWKPFLYKLHVYIGYLSFASLIITMIAGYQASGWFKREFSPAWKTVAILFSSLHLCLPLMIFIRDLVSFLSSSSEDAYESISDHSDTDGSQSREDDDEEDP